ncbi:hypothetical protein AVEN_16443-1, partial [Araneus ventricosus]
SGRHSQTRCLNHGIISNGRVIVILSFGDNSQPSEDDDDFEFPYGTRLKYTCDDGFVLVGEDTLRCGSNSYWTQSIPECVGGIYLNTGPIGLTRLGRKDVPAHRRQFLADVSTSLFEENFVPDNCLESRLGAKSALYWVGGGSRLLP